MDKKKLEYFKKRLESRQVELLAECRLRPLTHLPEPIVTEHVAQRLAGH